jgi:hypothetical protein
MSKEEQIFYDERIYKDLYRFCLIEIDTIPKLKLNPKKLKVVGALYHFLSIPILFPSHVIEKRIKTLTPVIRKFVAFCDDADELGRETSLYDYEFTGAKKVNEIHVRNFLRQLRLEFEVIAKDYCLPMTGNFSKLDLIFKIKEKGAKDKRLIIETNIKNQLKELIDLEAWQLAKVLEGVVCKSSEIHGLRGYNENAILKRLIDKGVSFLKYKYRKLDLTIFPNITSSAWEKRIQKIEEIEAGIIHGKLKLVCPPSY